jgi:DNA-directed RNA polymerase specialized sigma subunit
MKAAAAYDPALGHFEHFAYFRIRGAVIDSQRRQAYKEEANESLQALADPADRWLPLELVF